MKKNRMMRLASTLLVAVLITTSTISGTYAKYVTMDDAEDSARVAKFGVVVTADGSLFEDIYLNAPMDTDDGTATVVASDSTDVVAPGTNNADDAFKFSITGSPEVDVKVSVVVENADEDVFLKAGTYENLTTGDPDDETEVLANYYPVKYTLTKQGIPVIENKTLAELKTALEAISVDKVDANQNLGTLFGEYEISWKWDYNNTLGAPIDEIDQFDTILGDLAAGSPAAGLDGTPLTEGMSGDYNLNTGLKVTVRVEQID